MPATPVGQIPYPLATDKPVIPSDMKNLAITADGWISGLDSAFQGRIGGIASRLSGISSRVGAVNSNLSTLSTQMTSGDTAISAEQSSLTSVESRLSAQDATAAALQTRYTADNTALTNFANLTPSGGQLSLSFNNGVSSDASGGLLVVGGYNINVNAANPRWRASFVLAAGIRYPTGNYNGPVEIRICAGSPVASWNSYYQQAFIAKQGNSNTYAVSMSAIVSSGALHGAVFQIAVMCQGPSSGTQTTCLIQSSTLQYMQSGGN